MDAHTLECLEFESVRELLAGYAMTGLGKSLAAHVHPVTRFALLERWLNQVTELQRLIEERGLPPYGGITDVRAIVQRCGPPLRVGVEEMSQLGLTLRGTHGVAAYLRDLPADHPELQHLAGRIGDFQTIADRIAAVIDERGQVRNDASPKLLRIRRSIEEASERIGGVMDGLLRDTGIRKLLQYSNHTFHGDRMVLPLRAECRGRVPGIVHRTSDSGATLYVEPAAIVELNNQISNLRSEEQEEVGRLLWTLSNEVHVNTAEIERTLDALAVLDLITAKVRFARDYGLVVPELTTDHTLNVRGARHPLLLALARQRQQQGESAVEVVPIDYRLGLDFNLLIITGPNTGGKTVALKTIGLLSLMLQAGLPVPADRGSRMGLFGNVLIDVGDEQSLQQSLSTFSAHIRRIIDMLRHAGPHALLLIDELGAGTDPDEGAALGVAILDELARLQCRGVITTHLGVLKVFALTRGNAENACVDFDAETLRPTYHLRIGQAGHSNAIDIASKLGLPKRLAGAARRNISRSHRMLHTALEGTRSAKQQAEVARREADVARDTARQSATAADAVRVQLERQQADFQKWVQRVVHLQPGDAVRVRDFDRDGRIVRLRLDQHRAEVDVGAFTVEVPLGDVLPPETPPPPPKPPRPVAVAAPPPRPRKRDRSAPRSAPATRGAPGTAPSPATRPNDPQRPSQRPPRASEERERPMPPPLTVEQAAQLKPLDAVYVRRFHRVGRIVRILPDKKLAVVDVGALEVEVTFDGLAAVPAR